MCVGGDADREFRDYARAVEQPNGLAGRIVALRERYLELPALPREYQGGVTFTDELREEDRRRAGEDAGRGRGMQHRSRDREVGSDGPADRREQVDGRQVDALPRSEKPAYAAGFSRKQGEE